MKCPKCKEDVKELIDLACRWKSAYIKATTGVDTLDGKGNEFIEQYKQQLMDKYGVDVYE